MSFAEVNGVSLRYDWRPGQGVPLVLVHELGGALESWDLVLRHLPGRAALRMDLRGFGLSEKPRGALAMQDLARDVIGLADLIGIGTMHIAGGAFGGGVAVAAAALLAGRVDRLTGFAPATGVAPERRARVLALADRLSREGTRTFLEEDTIPKAWPLPRFAAEREGEGFAIFRATQYGTAPECLAATYRMFADTDLVPLLEKLACPVTFAAGLHDVGRPPSLVEPLAARCRQGSFVALDSGHFMALQSPAEVAALLA